MGGEAKTKPLDPSQGPALAHDFQPGLRRSASLWFLSSLGAHRTRKDTHPPCWLKGLGPGGFQKPWFVGSSCLSVFGRPYSYPEGSSIYLSLYVYIYRYIDVELFPLTGVLFEGVLMTRPFVLRVYVRGPESGKLPNSSYMLPKVRI